jgi:RNase P/RNase MRP subunit p30
MNKMTRLQRHYHKVTLDVLKERIQLWKDFENNKITLNAARENNLQLENKIDSLMQKKLEQLESAKK